MLLLSVHLALGEGAHAIWTCSNDLLSEVVLTFFIKDDSHWLETHIDDLGLVHEDVNRFKIGNLNWIVEFVQREDPCIVDDSDLDQALIVLNGSGFGLPSHVVV
jgi:hypothetical protein